MPKLMRRSRNEQKDLDLVTLGSPVLTSRSVNVRSVSVLFKIIFFYVYNLTYVCGRNKDVYDHLKIFYFIELVSFVSYSQTPTANVKLSI